MVTFLTVTVAFCKPSISTINSASTNPKQFNLPLSNIEVNLFAASGHRDESVFKLFDFFENIEENDDDDTNDHDFGLSNALNNEFNSVLKKDYSPKFSLKNTVFTQSVFVHLYILFNSWKSHLSN